MEESEKDTNIRPLPKEIHRLRPMDLKSEAWQEIHNCDSTADKVSRLSPKLSLWLPSF